MQQQDPRVDRSRGAVYQAEDSVATVMARPHRVVRVSGAILTLPEEVRFGSVDAVQSFVDHVLADAATSPHLAGRGPVRVRIRRGHRMATYADGTISIPAADPRGRWALTRSVMLHEVAHHLADESGHGPGFRSTLVELYRRHVSPSAAQFLAHLFTPMDTVPPSTPASGGDDRVRRVAALLAKAEATVHAGEAEAYLAKAALVAQRHSVDMAVAALGAEGRGGAPTHRMLTIGEPRRRLNKLLICLLIRVSGPWAVRVDIGHGSTNALIYGMPKDLDRVESVFATASSMMLSRAHAHVRGGSWRGSTYQPAPRAEPRPVTAAVARNAFLMGFITRLGANLDEAERLARSNAARSEMAASGPTAGRGVSPAQRVDIALRARELAVADYHRATSLARGTWRSSASSAGSAASSRRAGERAADDYGRKSVGTTRAAIGA